MMAKPVFLILTDSVALPRKHSDGVVLWNDTYVARLKDSCPDYDIVSVSIGGASITDLANQINYYKILNPKIVLLHCGIVDAAPRAFGRIELAVIKKLKLFRLTKPFVRFLRKYRSHHYASLGVFEDVLLKIKRDLNAERFYTLSILPSCNEYEQLMYGITESIENYNKVLKKHTEYIDLNQIPREGIVHDFHHINSIGHEYIFQQLQTRIFE
ncbi:SGNH/GDSL hydrolase family protein [Flavobacterium sedimenticola]|uniref:SGNH/GDSL hydrolase family protein n=1 Tax=Flavobacterium sedimenticola TaxID=3043286 RepID=A0ABT6XRJ3_9FLAO|nr:hypothetical protein [Flavobacterium sedimenticola]MDI9257708.1 hypothetical protein [Flavobacterium sedimenticola]